MPILRVREAFSSLSDPDGRVYVPGELVDSKNPIVKGRESLFEPVDVHVQAKANRGVESATSASGEKRSRTKAKPRKRPAAKKAAAAKPKTDKGSEPAKSEEPKPNAGEPTSPPASIEPEGDKS